MQKKMFLALLFSLGLYQLQAEATTPKAQKLPLKIGYANMAYILNFLPETKKVEVECASYEKQLKKQLEKEMEALNKKAAIFQKQQATMAEAERNKQLMELQRLHAGLEELQVELQGKLVNKRNSLLQPIHDKIEHAIAHIAKEDGYTYIFNHAPGLPVLLYVSEEGNISDLVLKKLGVNPQQDKKQ